jgi:peptidoglycan/LPS O-acetylase OafA/YrhL
LSHCLTAIQNHLRVYVDRAKVAILNNNTHEIHCQVPSGNPPHARYHSLEVWRGISCLLVVIGHSLEYASQHLGSANGIADKLISFIVWCCNIGVPFFFVISGFCIAACADGIRRKDTHSSRLYFWRRFRRIYPPFWTALLIAGVTYAIVNHFHPNYFSFQRNAYAIPQELSFWQWIGNLTLTEEWRYHLCGDGKQQMMGLAWTLCYEEQFYAVVGLILLFTRRYFFTGTALTTVLVLVLKHSLPRFGINTNGFFFDGAWLQFAAGILVYYSINYTNPRKKWLSYLIMLLVVPYAMRGLLGIGSTTVENHLIISLAFAVIILSLAKFDRKIIELKLIKPLLWCGTMCYSLYLVHYPIRTLLGRYMYYSLHITNSWTVLLVSLPLCLATSLFVGRLFFNLIERKCLNSSVV